MNTHLITIWKEGFYMKRGATMVRTYARKMQIDFFAFPIEKNGFVHIALIEPENIVNAIENDFPVVERRTGELFYRMKRQYSPIKTLPFLRPTHLIKTDIHKVKDIPPHCGMIARGFEVLVASALNAEHTGDKLKEVEVIQTVYGRIECKIGTGRLYWAAKD